ncbi:hypothetical protein RA23_15755 [Leisingera sp. ANG-S3]|nr:hypothetical protein RA23_15755 [Leisingera sp. ANG-S3]
MADLGIRAKAPSAHHLVVQPGPRLRCVLDGILPGKSKRAFGPAAPASLLLHIEEHEMRVGVPDVIAVLVVDGCDITGHTLAQSLRVGPRQGLSLLRSGFNRQGNYKPLTDAPFALLSLLFRQDSSLAPGAARKPFLDHNARRLWPCDIAQMGRCLARLRRTGFIRALL